MSRRSGSRRRYSLDVCVRSSHCTTSGAAPERPRVSRRRARTHSRQRVTADRAQAAASASSAAFVIGATVVGAANVASPFERGWWLAAYLFLVGGLAQLLLVRGQEALTHHPSASLVWAQWALWNTGTAIVAVADMAQLPAAVDAGSVALLIALVLFHFGARRPGTGPGRHASGLRYGYTALLLVLGSSVVLGTFLAGALPGQ